MSCTGRRRKVVNVSGRVGELFWKENENGVLYKPPIVWQITLQPSDAELELFLGEVSLRSAPLCVKGRCKTTTSALVMFGFEGQIHFASFVVTDKDVIGNAYRLGATPAEKIIAEKFLGEGYEDKLIRSEAK